MRDRLFAAACLLLWGFGLAGAANNAPHYYRARKGDTLWDLAGKRWKDPSSWPELWSLNPHISNPHRIEPGDPIFFDRTSRGAEVSLPLDRLGPPAPASSSAPTGGAGGAAGVAAAGSRDATAVAVERRSGGDFVSAHRIARLATLENRGIVKNIYSQGDDVEFRVAPESGLKPGDLATVFDDARAVAHPVSREPQGFLVRILGQLRVVSVAGANGVGRLVESYDTVGAGAGLMPFRAPVVSVMPKAARVGVEGVILEGNPDKSLFGSDDVVFLDRGSLHGLEPGVRLQIPVPETGRRSAEGLVDLERPLARLLVVSVEEKSAAGLIVESRATVSTGDRFVAEAVSP